MAGGLIALLDDVAMLARLAASSMDDVAAAAGKAGAKTAGVVIDDAAVTPKYVVGLSPSRELPIIGKITLGSLRNKLIILLPAALALSVFAPWAITPLLMLGGTYLCFEAMEKIWGALTGADHAAEISTITDPKELEDRQVSGAVRTDFILSAEIMAIALNELPDLALPLRAAALAVVAIAVTLGVYGAVAVLVKMDDLGIRLMRERGKPLLRRIGYMLVSAMPKVLGAISVIGTAAMLWVGGGIIVHGLEVFHLTPIPTLVHDAAHAAGAATAWSKGVIAWIVQALGSAAVGAVLGGAVVAAMHVMPGKSPAQH